MTMHWFRTSVALALGIVFVAAAVSSYQAHLLQLPWKSVPWALKALFSLMWFVQAYFLWRRRPPVQNSN